MNRRRFLTSTAASLAAGYAAPFADSKPRRVGIIGPGWYGKSDLFRLIQVAPVEIVSMCDVDKHMLSEAADMVSTRQASKKRPRTYADYREMLKEKDLDIVIVDPPDHWHALAMIAAVQSGADVWVQKPVSADIVEGQAMLAAARKYKKVAQVGTQRRSTPHLIEARDRVVKEGKLGKIGVVEIYCYYHMRNDSNFPDSAPPDSLDYDMWTGPAPKLAYNRIMHPRGWRAFMEYGNGLWETCACTCSTWSAGCLAWNGRSQWNRPAGSSSLRILKPTLPTRKPRPSITATSKLFGSTARMAMRQTPGILGQRHFTATRGP